MSAQNHHNDRAARPSMRLALLAAAGAEPEWIVEIYAGIDRLERVGGYDAPKIAAELRYRAGQCEGVLLDEAASEHAKERARRAVKRIEGLVEDLFSREKLAMIQSLLFIQRNAEEAAYMTAIEPRLPYEPTYTGHLRNGVKHAEAHRRKGELRRRAIGERDEAIRAKAGEWRKKNKYLSTDDISARVAREFKVSKRTIRRALQNKV